MSSSSQTCNIPVCSVQISQQIHRKLEYQIDEDFFWTDSKVVLDSTHRSQWRYVDTKQNTADEVSRGMKADELRDSCWILGPEMLWKKESEWLNDDERA